MDLFDSAIIDKLNRAYKIIKKHKIIKLEKVRLFCYKQNGNYEIIKSDIIRDIKKQSYFEDKNVFDYIKIGSWLKLLEDIENSVTAENIWELEKYTELEEIKCIIEKHKSEFAYKQILEGIELPDWGE